MGEAAVGDFDDGGIGGFSRGIDEAAEEEESPVGIGVHELHGAAEAFDGEALEEDIVLKDDDFVCAGGETLAKAGKMGFEDAAFAVGEVFVGDDKFNF